MTKRIILLLKKQETIKLKKVNLEMYIVFQISMNVNVKHSKEMVFYVDILSHFPLLTKTKHLRNLEFT